MTETDGRAQDQGRPHSRKRRVPQADRSLIDAYRDALRAELRDAMAELRPADTAQRTLDGTPDRHRPSLDTRQQLVRFMALCVKELGADLDEEDEAPAPVDGTPRRRGRTRFQ